MVVKTLLNIPTLLILCPMLCGATAPQCREAESSIYGMMLKRHVITKITGISLGGLCLLECYRDVRCQSYNFLISRATCELNNRTKEARPADFVPDSGRYYFRRDMNRVPLGSIPELPAQTCKEIKASEGGQAVSGEYWFDSIIPGKTVLAHCDMKNEDVDECSVSIPLCDVNADCKNTRGSYRCTCKAGFTGDGKTCTDINECSAALSDCDANADCQNNQGSFSCSCKAGFTGDGKTCTADASSNPGACAAVGVEDPDIIPNAKMTASSNYLPYYPYNGRLNGNTGWCQKTSSITGTDYLQVDMGVTRSICAVATQGKKNGSYVTSYKLKLSSDGVHWTTYKENNVDKVFQANTDTNSIKHHTLNNAAVARYVRFYPVTRSNFPCMRAEVYVQ